MVQEIIWLPEAEATFLAAISYLLENFTEKEVAKFSERVRQKLLVIDANPRLGTKGGKKANVYKTVIHKRIILFYQHKPIKKEIVLLMFWNTLQNPRKLKI